MGVSPRPNPGDTVCRRNAQFAIGGHPLWNTILISVTLGAMVAIVSVARTVRGSEFAHIISTTSCPLNVVSRKVAS